MNDYMGNSNKKKEIIEKYNSTSDFYDKRYKKIQEEKYKVTFNSFQIEKKVFLDVGCGSGLLFEFILKEKKNYHIKALNYIGIDISLNMLKLFVKKYRSWIKNVNINLILADVENLPLRNNKVDLIYSITSLQNLSNMISGIKEIIMVSKHMANLHLSILKKTLNLELLVLFLKPNIINLKITNIENIEDLILQGNLIKN
ncbi:MAG: class I SAM-dependent methyltransferase [Promethearchaeota archaeon]